MPSTMKISLLALAGSATAAPHYGAHSKYHHRPSGGYAGPSAGWGSHHNHTRPHPTGTGVVPLNKQTTMTTVDSTLTETIFSTVYLTLSPSPVAASSVPVAAADVSTGAGACGPATLYVTATDKVTVTVPAGGASPPAYTPPTTPEASSVVPEAPSSSVPGEGYGLPSSFVLASSSAVKEQQPSTKAAKSTPVPTPEGVKSTAPAYTPASSAASASSVAPASSVAASSAVPSSSPSSSPSYSGGKRGLCYRWDGAADAKSFSGKNFGFAWNWESKPMGDIGSTSFVPTLRSMDRTGEWNTDVEAAISSGSKVVFGLNEPDIPTQANLGVSALCDAWKTYMNPIAEKHSDVTIVGPSISSSENANQGLDYLKQFQEQCTDAVWHHANLHWYGPPSAGFDAFKAHFEKAAAQVGKPLWVSEFGLTGASADESAAFLKQVMSYLDSNDNCKGYSYYAVGSFDPSANLLGNAESLTATGEVYVA